VAPPTFSPVSSPTPPAPCGTCGRPVCICRTLRALRRAPCGRIAHATRGCAMNGPSPPRRPGPRVTRDSPQRQASRQGRLLPPAAPPRAVMPRRSRSPRAGRRVRGSRRSDAERAARGRALQQPPTVPRAVDEHRLLPRGRCPVEQSGDVRLPDQRIGLAAHDEERRRDVPLERHAAGARSPPPRPLVPARPSRSRTPARGAPAQPSRERTEASRKDPRRSGSRARRPSGRDRNDPRESSAAPEADEPRGRRRAGAPVEDGCARRDDRSGTGGREERGEEHRDRRRGPRPASSPSVAARAWSAHGNPS
jgi:hypothetical protein